MPVLLCLITAPIGLCVLLGMSWFEDHVLRPPTSPADRVVRNQATVDLLRIVPTPQSAAGKAKPLALPSSQQGSDSAA